MPSTCTGREGLFTYSAPRCDNLLVHVWPWQGCLFRHVKHPPGLFVPCMLNRCVAMHSDAQLAHCLQAASGQWAQRVWAAAGAEDCIHGGHMLDQAVLKGIAALPCHLAELIYKSHSAVQLGTLFLLQRNCAILHMPATPATPATPPQSQVRSTAHMRRQGLGFMSCLRSPRRSHKAHSAIVPAGKIFKPLPAHLH
jgi:hypothetical protein